MPFLIILIICIASGLKANNGFALLLSVLVGVFIGTIIQTCWMDAKYKEKQKAIKINNSAKKNKQNNFDNFGIIEYKDK